MFDFVFGPPKPAVDHLADEREVLAFLRDHRGRITASDLAALTGYSLARSEEELTRMMVAFHGDAEVTSEGAIIFVFPDSAVEPKTGERLVRVEAVVMRTEPDEPDDAVSTYRVACSFTSIQAQDKEFVAAYVDRIVAGSEAGA